MTILVSELLGGGGGVFKATFSDTNLTHAFTGGDLVITPSPGNSILLLSLFGAGSVSSGITVSGSILGSRIVNKTAAFITSGTIISGDFYISNGILLPPSTSISANTQAQAHSMQCVPILFEKDEVVTISGGSQAIKYGYQEGIV